MAIVTNATHGPTLPVYIVGIVACITQLAIAILSICIVMDKTMEHYIIKSAIAASVLDMAMAILLLGSMGAVNGRSSSWLIVSLRIIGLAVWFCGNLLSLIVFGFTLVAAQSGIRSNRYAHILATAGLAVGVAGLVPQAAFIILISPRMEQATLAPVEIVEAQQISERVSKQGTILRSLPLTRISTTTDPFASQVGPRSAMEWPSSPTSLLRDSMRRVIRPVTSRTKLISTRSSTPRNSYSLQVERTQSAGTDRYDGFENWDTSSVEERFEYSGHSSAQPSRTVLETIPGSRPMSLIPTLDESQSEPLSPPREREDPLPDSPTYPAISPMSETGSPSPLTTHARPRGDSSSQSHIHPLFRTESPGPRPVVTPGTVIVASPHAGQIVGPDHSLSPRKVSFSASRAPSPAVLSRKESRGSLRLFPSMSRPGSAEPPRSMSQLSQVSSVDRIS